MTEQELDRVASSPAHEYSEPKDVGFQSRLSWQMIEPLLGQMQPELADCLTMFYRHKMPQRAIGRLWGISQQAASWRILKAKAALRYLVVRRDACGDFTLGDVRRDCRGVLNSVECLVLWNLHLTSCQEETAQRMGMRQNRVRLHYWTILEKLEKHERLFRYRASMLLLQQHWSVLRIVPIYIQVGKRYPARIARSTARRGAKYR
jgi:hypothetical protein